jgi:hypothetical protein
MPRLLKGEYEAAEKIARRLREARILASDTFRDEMDIWSGGELSMRQIDILEDYASRRVPLMAPASGAQ